ncbi:uncharacterized protein LOC110676161 [Aedes aegypti]|uniref:Uncharacterized protein n=1 Tax=Aedes aegypti TaxID=7159 RepID=A0A6I8U457_AEDAE|nr:uncharacterized protein LOC110676161 [Aedes aegypti]
MYSHVESTIRIHDLNKNPLAIIPIGKAKLQLGHVRIIQPVNFTYFEDIIENFDEMLRTNKLSGKLYQVLKKKHAHLYNTYYKLKPNVHRRKRWNSLGTAWKWIAGNPDAEDLRIINQTMNNLIEYNNQQVFVNNAMDTRIQQISKITNDLLELDFKTKLQHEVEMNILIAILNIDAVQNQLEVLEDAILLAKHGIPSSRILSMTEYAKIKPFLEQQNVHVTTFEKLLSKSSAQVTMNNTHVIYMLKIPQLSSETYEYEFIDSLVQNQKRVHLYSNYILYNSTKIYEISNECTQDETLYICDTKILKTPSQCIRNLIRIQHANCTYEKVYTTGNIKHIDEATLLLNDVNVSLHSNCTNNTQRLNGSYIIQFEHCELYLDNNIYRNSIINLNSKTFRPTTGLLVEEDSIIDIPSPEFLANLTLNHRGILEHVYLQNESLKWKQHIFEIMGSSGILIIIIILVIGIIIKYWKPKQTNINIKISEQPTATAPISEEIRKPENESSSYTDISTERFLEIQKFLNMPTQERSIRL